MEIMRRKHQMKQIAKDFKKVGRTKQPDLKIQI